MFKIHKVKKNTFQAEYQKLLLKLYNNSKAFKYYCNDLIKGLEYSTNSVFQTTSLFLITDEDITIATFALIKDIRMAKDKVFFGFFESENNNKLLDFIWKSILEESKKIDCQKILGPVNGSIWHQYRFVSKSNKEITFPSEPITKSYYFDFFASKKTVKVTEYHSAYRTNFDVILKYTEPSYQKAIDKNVEIVRITNFDLELLKVIYRFSSQIFSKSWGFVPLNFEEFLELYNSEKIEDFIGSLYLTKVEDRIVGFCMNIETEDAIIMKTIAVIPEFQKHGLGNALVYAVHNEAKTKNKDYVIYALINKKNKIQHFPQEEVVILREYVAFEFDIL